MSDTPNQTRPAVILVNRGFVINDGLIIAIRRSGTNKNNPRLWEVPGGKLDEGQDLKDALIREVKEEIGLEIEPIDTIAHFESKVIRGGGRYDGMPYVALFGLSKVLGGQLRLSEEHTDYLWCSFSEFTDLELTPETRNATDVLKKRLLENGVR